MRNPAFRSCGRRPRLLGAAAVGLALLLAGCAARIPRAPAVAEAPRTDARAEAAPQPTACPAALGAVAQCWAGRDQAGAYYLIARPRDWQGTLVLHAHGGPSLEAPSPARALEDLERWAIMVRAGHAWAGSTFRQGGVEVRAAAEDTERLRQIAVRHLGTPRRTVLHGQSWGASVAARGAEMFTATPESRPPYDAVLLTSGVLAGGTRSYDFRTDLRVVYQHLCQNHPRSDEPAYPLNIGLPAGSTLTPAQLRSRVDECLGLHLPAAQRTSEQQRKLKVITQVIRIPAGTVQGHLAWATFHFRDVVQHRTGGASPFGNQGAFYRGSDDDAALNAAVLRYRADPAAVARFAQDSDPSGRIPVPVLTVKGVDDGTAFVELDAAFRETMERAGSADRLVQTFTRHSGHSYLSDPTYPTLMAALLRWVDTGERPSPAAIAAQCPAQEARFGPGCAFVPDYQPAPLASRVPPRDRP